MQEGIYYSPSYKYVYVKLQPGHGWMYRKLNNTSYLSKFSHFSTFNPKSIMGTQLTPTILNPIEDNVVISSIYPELFI